MTPPRAVSMMAFHVGPDRQMTLMSLKLVSADKPTSTACSVPAFSCVADAAGPAPSQTSAPVMRMAKVSQRLINSKRWPIMPIVSSGDEKEWFLNVLEGQLG
jgi:hypothetical protein